MPGRDWGTDPIAQTRPRVEEGDPRPLSHPHPTNNLAAILRQSSGRSPALPPCPPALAVGSHARLSLATLALACTPIAGHVRPLPPCLSAPGALRPSRCRRAPLSPDPPAPPAARSLTGRGRRR